MRNARWSTGKKAGINNDMKKKNRPSRKARIKTRPGPKVAADALRGGAALRLFQWQYGGSFCLNSKLGPENIWGRE